MITLKIAAPDFFPSLAPTQIRFYGKPGDHSENELVWQFEDGVSTSVHWLSKVCWQIVSLRLKTVPGRDFWAMESSGILLSWQT